MGMAPVTEPGADSGAGSEAERPPSDKEKGASCALAKEVAEAAQVEEVADAEEAVEGAGLSATDIGCVGQELAATEAAGASSDCGAPAEAVAGGASSLEAASRGVEVGCRQSAKPKQEVEGGLGFGGLPTTASAPQALGPECSAAESASHGSQAGSQEAAPATEQLPPKMSQYKEGRLRTTVNTPETLVSEADAETPLEPEQYMYYAQQYAALAQQYAAYAQYCAQFAPQAAAAAASSTGAAGGTSGSSAVANAPSPAGAADQSQASSTQASKNTPIMVTPYRHNWLISGAHREDGKDVAWVDNLSTDLQKTVSSVRKYFVGCRTCMPGGKEAENQCKQM